MKKTAWQGFCEARTRFKVLTDTLRKELPELGSYQQKLVDARGGPAYTVETPVVYNEALEDIEPSSNIKLILVADNPGRREQAAENRRYLVGPSGKIAERFFREQLDIDFRKNVIILNKTPIHTPRTVELKELCRSGGTELVAALETSQRSMAEILWEFHRALSPLPVWIIGYSEMKKGGIFETYTETLREIYAKQNSRRREELFFYRHFSMNQFTIDLSQQRRDGEETDEALKRIGAVYRERILFPNPVNRAILKA
jgi:hypothetical protein